MVEQGAGLRAGPGVVLVGLPGSGKTTVGRLLAERLGRPFVDTDELIGARTGMPASEVLRTRGEPAFRALEREALLDACADPAAVVAPGAGALSDPLDRWRLWEHGRVVWLRAPEEVLLARLAADGTPRPLLEGSPAERLAALADERAPFYRAADAIVDGSGPPERVAEDVVRGAETSRSADASRPRYTSRPAWPGRRLFDAEEPRHHPIGPKRARIVFGHGFLEFGDALADGRTLADGPLAETLSDIGGSPRLIADRRAFTALTALARMPPAHMAADHMDRAPSPGTPGPRSAGLTRPSGSDRRLLLSGGERAKRLSTLGRVLAWLAATGAERGDPVVAMGGGTVIDLAGLAAALYARGAPLVAVPTTWLAQADAALGGKMAVDLPGAKNAAGAFWPPWAVLADTAALATLPLARRRDGLVEALKAALIGDPALWELIATRGRAALEGATPGPASAPGADEPARYAITERAARVKLAIVLRDPFEECERRQLNLGHTLGHALEVESGYRLPHGAAVALGLRAATSIAAARGADPALPAALDDMLAAIGLRRQHRFDRDRVRAALATDKKRHAGRQRWLLPMGIGRVVEVDDVTEHEMARAIEAVHGDG